MHQRAAGLEPPTTSHSLKGSPGARNDHSLSPECSRSREETVAEEQGPKLSGGAGPGRVRATTTTQVSVWTLHVGRFTLSKQFIQRQKGKKTTGDHNSFYEQVLSNNLLLSH